MQKRISSHLLDDKKVFVDASLSKVPAISRLIENLGGKVVGVGAPFVDLDNRKQLHKLDFLSKGITAVIGNGQYFEKANALKKGEVDIYVSEFYGSSFAADEGATVVSTRNRAVYGFDGVYRLYDSFVKAIRLTNKITDDDNSNYKLSWKSKSGNWYVKQEVS